VSASSLPPTVALCVRRVADALPVHIEHEGELEAEDGNAEVTDHAKDG